ncbi:MULTISPECIES: FxsA family protein [unclassified Mycolicibacterium]|uniref:FxsA family protein n=1 Tax=unclassified Mycolicibacterium TaxID=2636767 RepID=UPI001F4BECFB|nr:FxsA family protein [Mycolicibacterium sp. YH-1]UNB55301.1 membrane protein FxsA [Mycolicibacterium sp. YH-1]
MAMRLFLVYVLVELAVVVWLASTIGFGWTILLLVGTFAVGLALAGSQLKRQIQRLQSGLVSPQGAVTDGALVAIGTVLTVIPGLVTSALGLLLLAPPTRVLARPAVAALAARRLGRMPLIVTTAGQTGFRAGPNGFPPARGDYIDGEVIDVTDSEQDSAQSTLPQPPRPI